MSEQERTHRAVRALLHALEPAIRWRKERKQCPACGEQMEDVIPHGRVCLNSRCDAYRGNYAAARMHGRPDWSRSTWILETASKALAASFALAGLAVLLVALTAMTGTPPISPDSTVGMALLGWFLVGAFVGLLRHPLFGPLFLALLAIPAVTVYAYWRGTDAQ